MRVINLIESLTRRAGWVGAVLIFPLIGALVYEVFSRYVLGQPTLWAFEISYMVMGAIFMLGMANALRVGQHVSVDILSLQLGQRSNALVRLVGYVLFLPILVWLVWELSKYALAAFESNERSGRSAWNPVIWPVFTVWFVGFLLLALQVLAELLKSLAILMGRPVDGEGKA
ncbi:TRAP transporter small permease subunit [Halomonas sp. CKK8]|jgi:TRAP-type mannitol/chloroaromatic compound transport system permease small subunit|uniref:TRAP transporter small permease subunit n=1 Tax=Halomonas sp. CKK8 TaxID=3036127 RepID=UPI0024158D97|nr:TRAP transporter small permease subunit [Halomonas sp. CKK8]WFM70120.1 TRAP transporter small permease subunit [Halomonas sp. CKK8]